ncbi:MAG: hypothetical protein ABI882_05610 [Acidobacteriota bacterium]
MPKLLVIADDLTGASVVRREGDGGGGRSMYVVHIKKKDVDLCDVQSRGTCARRSLHD